MLGVKHMRRGSCVARAGACLLALVSLVACTTAGHIGGQPETAAAPAPPPESEPAIPAPPQPPPVDLAGRWKLSAAGGGACLMNLGDNPGAAEGSVAPAGGCPGNFFMSRKWKFDHDALIIRDYKGQTLAELSFTGSHFEGKDANGGAITLARP
jgi:hypothetical protein